MHNNPYPHHHLHRGIMKKTIAILLVAVLAAGSVFAGFSGSATVTAGYNFETGEYGFFKNGNNVKVNIDLDTQSAEKAAEGDVYASIKAAFAVKAINNTFDGDKFGNVDLKAKAFLKEAKINGSNWYVSIKGLMSSYPDFAKSAVDSYKDFNNDWDWDYVAGDKVDTAASYKPGYAKAPGVEIGYADFVAGVGLNKSASGTVATGYVKTPEFAFDAVKAQAAVVASKAAGSSTKNLGVSAKASYATDVLSASVATDVGFAIADQTKVNADVAANFKYDFVTVDAYYGTLATTKMTYDEATKTKTYSTTKNLLSAKLVTDLNGFNVPVKLTVTGKDLINKQNLSGAVEVKVAEGLTVKANGGYVVADKKISLGASVEYKAAAFTAKAAAGYNWVLDATKAQLTASASVETDVLVPGATLKLAYGAADNDQNLLADQAIAQDFGKVVASATIKF